MPSELAIFTCTGRKAVRRADEGNLGGGDVCSSERGLTCYVRSVAMAAGPWDSLVHRHRA